MCLYLKGTNRKYQFVWSFFFSTCVFVFDYFFFYIFLFHFSRFEIHDATGLLVDVLDCIWVECECECAYSKNAFSHKRSEVNKIIEDKNKSKRIKKKKRNEKQMHEMRVYGKNILKPLF